MQPFLQTEEGLAAINQVFSYFDDDKYPFHNNVESLPCFTDLHSCTIAATLHRSFHSQKCFRSFRSFNQIQTLDGDNA